MEVVQGADKTKATQDTLEQVGDMQEVREPHDPATNTHRNLEGKQDRQKSSKATPRS